MASIEGLPLEILEHILSFLSPYDDLKSCFLVCQHWYTCCNRVVHKKKQQFISAVKSGCIEWCKPKIQSNMIPITRRYSHCSCVYESSMYVFGGCTATSTTFNDLWKFDMSLYKWTRLNTTGTYPSPKAYASMVLWNTCLILFGGWTHPSFYPLHQQWVLFNELHMYDIQENKWHRLYYPGFPTSLPPTAGHSATIHNDCMVVFGGLKMDGAFSSTNDLYCLDLFKKCWFKPVLAHCAPNPRYGHSQIKIDDKHLMIMAGCGGSNKLYSDIWLLTLPENIHDQNSKWLWTQVKIDNSENMPPQIWYNPACKVGNDYVVVLSTVNRSRSDNSGNAAGSMSQLYVPSSLRRQQLWVPLLHQAEQRRQNVQAVPDVNVNGQRGVLARQNAEEALLSRPLPRSYLSVRPNASYDRKKRLEVLSKMEQRLRYLSQKKNVNKSVERVYNRNLVVPYLLNINELVSYLKVKWCPLSLNDSYSPVGTPPQPTLLYSLCLGRGHLIMFGGIPHDPTGVHKQEQVSNEIIYISAHL